MSCSAGLDRLRQLLGQLAGGGPRLHRAGHRVIEGRLQIVSLCAEGARALIFQFETGQLALAVACKPPSAGAGLVELPLQPGQLLLPLLLVQAGRSSPAGLLAASVAW